MQTEQIIDLRNYFSRQQEQNVTEDPRHSRMERLLWGIQRAAESVSAVVIALCVTLCTLVFFTML